MQEQQEEAARAKAIRIAAENAGTAPVPAGVGKQAPSAEQKKRKADAAELPDRGQHKSVVAAPATVAVAATAAPAKAASGGENVRHRGSCVMTVL